MIKIERLRFRYIWSMMTRSIHECWHVRTNKCVRTNICKKSVFVVSVRIINICGRILTQFTGLLRTNTVAAKRNLLAERTCLGKSVVDFLKESRWLYDGLNRIGCRDGLPFLPTPMVTDYKQVMRDRTTRSEIFGAWMKDVTCRTVARFRTPWPNKVPKDRMGAGVKQTKNLFKTNSSKEIRTRFRLTSHGSSGLNLSKFDESRTTGFDWSSENLRT